MYDAVMMSGTEYYYVGKTSQMQTNYPSGSVTSSFGASVGYLLGSASLIESTCATITEVESPSAVILTTEAWST